MSTRPALPNKPIQSLTFPFSPQRDLCLGLSAIFLPPLPVLIRTGCGAWFVGSIIATLFAWVPGIVFAVVVIILYPSGSRRRRRKEKKMQMQMRRRGVESPDARYTDYKRRPRRNDDAIVYNDRRPSWASRVGDRVMLGEADRDYRRRSYTDYEYGPAPPPYRKSY